MELLLIAGVVFGILTVCFTLYGFNNCAIDGTGIFVALLLITLSSFIGASVLGLHNL